MVWHIVVIFFIEKYLIIGKLIYIFYDFITRRNRFIVLSTLSIVLFWLYIICFMLVVFLSQEERHFSSLESKNALPKQRIFEQIFNIAVGNSTIVVH